MTTEMAPAAAGATGRRAVSGATGVSAAQAVSSAAAAVGKSCERINVSRKRGTDEKDLFLPAGNSGEKGKPSSRASAASRGIYRYTPEQIGRASCRKECRWRK